MEESEQRNVLNSTLVLDRKAVITAVAIDHHGSRIFLGLEDGMLEEYTLTMGESGVSASLTARKPIVAKVNHRHFPSFLNSYTRHHLCSTPISLLFNFPTAAHPFHPSSHLCQLSSSINGRCSTAICPF